MKQECGTCWFWEYRTQDDGNTRYGRCSHAYEGADEAYPWSDILLDLDGPSECKDVVTPILLTAEGFRCKDWSAK